MVPSQQTIPAFRLSVWEIARVFESFQATHLRGAGQPPSWIVGASNAGIPSDETAPSSQRSEEEDFDDI